VSSNGAREDRAPEDWAAQADAFKYVQDHHVREGFVSSLERDKELYVLGARTARTLSAHRDEAAKREVANLGDHAMIMRSLGRIESSIGVLVARVDGVVVQLHGAEGEIGFLGRESVEHEKAERELRVKIAAVESEGAAERARMAERASMLERRVVELSNAVGDAAKDGAVAKFVAREAFESIHEQEGEAIEGRKDRREYKKLVAWFVLALALAGIGTALRVRYGAENVPQFPAAPHDWRALKGPMQHLTEYLQAASAGLGALYALTVVANVFNPAIALRWPRVAAVLSTLGGHVADARKELGEISKDADAIKLVTQ
jgi:hypothetical protein